MRLAWYAGVSTALAATVVVSAFHQRANFYSAMVYLAQSNFCLLVLVNFIYLIYGTMIYGLQRLLYGPLRQVEVEQLSERAWFAITETCLAMTIFREEIGAWFLVMFTALVTGKVWGWIGDGRVEVLEQQPPTNPGLFHTRLSISLLLSLVYDIWLLRYTVNTVIQQARPNMMVMFLFEFAVLATCSARTGIRYMVSVMEQNIIKTQTRQRLEERRRQVREEREELLRQREHDNGAGDDADLPREEDVDEMDIEVPGWEAKGQWILILDLFADCVKLAIYLVFFGILLTFYGLPIHIMRDLFMTARSVIKRGSALWRYRKAVEDMNKYPDATQEELSREDTCIICREEMRPWDPSAGAVERVRPKKLPCGHILHFGCLKSWLERQQVCPTCRSPVVVNNNAAAPQNREAVLARIGLGGLGAAPAAPAGQQPPADNAPAAPGGQPAQQAPRNGAARVFQLGPLRLGFAQGENMQQLAQQMGVPPEAIPTPLGQGAPAGPFTPAAQTPGANNMSAIRGQIQHLEQMIQREVQSLQHMHQELQTLQLLTAELGRIRQLQQQQEQAQNMLPNTGAAPVVNIGATQLPLPTMPMTQVPIHPTLRVNGPVVTRHGASNHSNAIPAGSAELPEGVVIPPGWSLLPLQRLDGTAASYAPQPFPESAPSASGETSTSEVPASTQQSTTTAQAPETSSPAAQTAATSPEPRQESVPGSSASTGRSEPPPVIAPNPVLPNWGGANQLFGNGRGLSGLGNPAPSESSADERRDEPASRSSETAAAREESAEDEHKGKGKAVTVEEAEDDE
ncbi:ERAD-associated E3 ubiquitin-protein ligase HRD1 [Colletotrichum aenigma]|uniref:ERAD-associated E3 ubiquitin-protein ligase HRD1 n=1 Tax=Colletotrichum aenigma TaxID=1215731 RepID=UPI0018723569|nr:ERAD-associated E3 ubiquitin-protein ligase HRD1 [Colletotrichum aenigma]KAF5519976.1 ERAD-associated E3 ubiquitin-protein ligase HRD1 [Colletotrichum aenigma]